MKTKIVKIVFLLALLGTACNKEVLDKVNPNGGTPESYYSSADELTKGVNAIYGIIQSSSLASREWFFLHDLRSDDAASGGGQLEGPRGQVLAGTHDAANSVMTQVWNGLYRTIHRANSVIEGAPKTENISDELRNRLVAEAKFLRAWAYSDLTAFWGAVPMYDKPAKALSDSKARTKEDDVYLFAIKDLQEAQAVLPTTYSADNAGRATKGAAQALLGRLYMQKGDYASAKAELEKVKNSNVYKLVDNYTDNFLEETGFNAESVFEIGFQGNSFNWNSDGNDYGNNEGNSRTQEYSAIGWRNLIPSDGLLAEFERVSKGDAKNDPRFASAFYRSGDSFNNGKLKLDTAKVQGNLSSFEGKREKVSWRKYTSLYKNDATFYTGAMNMRIIRYAEVLLMLAECENEAGNTGSAVGYLNQVRSRPSVNMPTYPTPNFTVGNKAEVFRAIVHEKRVEFAGEQIRNRDIVRWRKQGKLAAEPISYFQKNKHELLPIPQQEITTNASLSQTSQNPGY